MAPATAAPAKEEPTAFTAAPGAALELEPLELLSLAEATDTIAVEIKAKVVENFIVSLLMEWGGGD